MSQLIVELRRSADILDRRPSEVYGLNRACRDAADEIERLTALILDACDVFSHYDLPEHAFHYRRALDTDNEQTTREG